MPRESATRDAPIQSLGLSPPELSIVQIVGREEPTAMGSGCSSAQSSGDPSMLSLSHYEIHRVIGKGGFGKVNAVIRKRTSPPEWFALKTLSKAVVLEKRCTKMIWNERNLLATISCEHIVRMHHAFQDSANCYVVMDLLLGGDLKFHLTSRYKGGFGESHTRFYVAGLLLALQYLHSQHILHRDIKPDNVILDNDGYPRLTDLGVSVKTDTLRYKGNSGTTSYMAPEMFVGSNEHGIGADMYALGVMCGELLFGKKLWSGSARTRIDANPAILDGIVPVTDATYYPSELLDSTEPSTISKTCRAFVRGLLFPAESGRLGFNGVQEAMDHEWFVGFDWAKYAAKTLPPPFRPTIDENQANCNTAAQDFDDVLEQSSRPTKKSSITSEQQQSFDGFEFNVDLSVPAKGVPMAH